MKYWRDNDFKPDPSLFVPPMELLVQAVIKAENVCAQAKKNSNQVVESRC